MEKIIFSEQINAPKEKLWESLWNIHQYQTWTSAFVEGSTVKTDNWQEGTRIYFLDGHGRGMYSEILQNKPNEYMSFRHLGTVTNGREDTPGDQASAWAGATENYRLTEKDGGTFLEVETEITEDFKDYMMKTWPVAMAKLKGLAEGTEKPMITISAVVKAPADKAWESWSQPQHLMQWNQASDDWHCPAASMDMRSGGKFSATMAAKDGSFSFDFGGDYVEVKEKEFIHAVLGDGRVWKTWFRTEGDKTIVTEMFEAENMHSLDMQEAGWQSILNNYKKYTETL